MMKAIHVFVVAVGVCACGVGAQADVVMDWVFVGDPGNVADARWFDYTGRNMGGVAEAYNIGKYEVTNSQYAGLLNAVAASDPNNLYNPLMASDGGITRSGASPNYTYNTITGRENMPVNFVDWYDTLRFANWLHNDQPTGGQNISTTEAGAYSMNLGASVVRRPDALVFLPTDDEWYKAAYYKGGGTDAGYWNYPIRSSTAPTGEDPPGTDMVNGSANFGHPWEGQPGYNDHATEVGAYTALPSDSPYGTFDQGGNITEWVELDMVGDGSYRLMRGGSFYSDSVPLHGFYTYYNGWPINEMDNLGFRVAAVPEPATIALLALGGVGLFGRRRR